MRSPALLLPLLFALLAPLGCGPAARPPAHPRTAVPARAPATAPASAPARPAVIVAASASAARFTLRPPLSAEPTLVVSITKRALTIALRARVGGERTVLATVARPTGSPGHDYAAFNRALARLVRTRWPDATRRPPATTRIIVVAAPDTTYEALVRVMDSARAVHPGAGVTDAGRVLFPDVILGIGE